MNKTEKQKGWLMGLGVGLIIVSILLIIFGIMLTASGAKTIAIDGGGVVSLVFGIIMLILFAPTIVIGIYFLWIGSYITATKGSIKEGNLAKEGGTVNMIKCEKCGQEIVSGEDKCSNCTQEQPKK